MFFINWTRNENVPQIMKSRSNKFESENVGNYLNDLRRD